MSILTKIQEMELRNTGKVSSPVDLLSPPAPTIDEAAQAKVLTLPLWPVAVRGVPNSVLRSALFGAIKRGKRAYQDAVKKASVDGVTVIHTGPQLDQADLDVWEECLHLARTEGLGTPITFSAHGFLKSIERGTGKSQHEWLKGSLRRLMTSLVEIQDGRKVYAGQLIHHWARDEETGQHVIEINPRLALLYGADGWTQIEREQRMALKGHPLSQWLHSFYSTHAKPFPYKVETIHELCGSEAKLLKHFRAELKTAMDRVSEVTGWQWVIDEGDLLRISGSPSRSQKRHISKRQPKPKGSKPLITGLKQIKLKL